MINVRIELPSNVKEAIGLLEAAGFECLIVGGCVRDALMEIEPHDYDLTTSATPDEMLSVFSGYRVIPTGIKHGTLTVLIGDEPLEITTFRTDGEYLDNRRPESVSFSRNIADDLSRRDFTVNAMAYSEKQGLVDCFGGVDDLKNKVIRAVGEPDRRFNEDGLRIMRGLRFAATLGFSIESETADSIHRCRRLLNNIAVERLWVELSKLIRGVDAARILRDYSDVIGEILPEILPMIGFDQKTRHHCYDVYEHTLRVLDNCDPSDTVLRLAAFFHDVGKPETQTFDQNGAHFYGHAERSAEITDAIFRRFHTDNATRDQVVRLISEHCRQIEPTERSVRRFLASHDATSFDRYVKLYRADRLACAPDNRDTSSIDKIEAIAARLFEADTCLSLKTLAVKGDDLIALGYRGREIGMLLNELLDGVITGRLENDRNALLAEIKQKK